MHLSPIHGGKISHCDGQVLRFSQSKLDGTFRSHIHSLFDLILIIKMKLEAEFQSRCEHIRVDHVSDCTEKVTCLPVFNSNVKNDHLQILMGSQFE